MKCQNCQWVWDIEQSDDNPYLCHKCGYDSHLRNFDMVSLYNWKKENSINEVDPKVGTGKKPKGSGRRLYTDENPNDTVPVKFRTKEDIVDTLNKSSFKNKSHKRQSQIINLIHQRVRAAYNNAKNEDTKKRLKRGLDYITKKKEQSKEKTKKMNEQNLPFKEENKNGYVIRDFSYDTDDSEFVWHRDREDRIVESIGDTDWMVQIDNELPKPLTESVYIPKGKYHRLIKGNGDLKIKVNKIINEGMSIEKKLQVALDYAFDYLRNICTDEEEYFLHDFCNEFDTIQELKINRVEKSEYKDYFDVYVDIKLNCINYYDYEYDFFHEIKKRFPVDGFFLILNNIIRPKLDR